MTIKDIDFDAVGSVAGFIGTSVVVVSMLWITIQQIGKDESAPPTTLESFAPDQQDLEDKKIERTFTVFNTKKHLRYRVVTGHSFEDYDQELPHEQFCYIAANTNSGLEQNFHFANKVGNKPVTYVFNMEAGLRQLASDAGSDYSVVKYASDDCYWIDGESNDV